MTFWKWSKTSASNGTADSSINYAEGMAPSGLNDSGRAVMAAAAKYRDDISGSIVTGGTSTAYTVSSNQVFDTLANLDGAMIAFTPHTTNGVNPTLNVDGLGAKAISMDGFGTHVPSGTLVQGTPYTAVYQNATSDWRLRDFYQLPYIVPIGGMIDYFGATAPNSSFVLPFGQAISRTTYSTLFSLIGTNLGVGDGSTTFNIPDLRGRIVAGKDNMGGSAASRLTTPGSAVDGATLGAVGGAENITLSTGQIPAHSHANTVNDPGHAHTYNQPAPFGASGSGAGINGTITGGTTSSSTTGITINNVNAGGGGAHINVQPTIVGNKLLRII